MRKDGRACDSDKRIQMAIQFIFNPDNVQLLSWDSIRVPYNGQSELFPGIIRKRLPEVL